MSDYSRSKVVRLKATLEELDVSDIWDLEEKYPELFSSECYTEYKKSQKPYFEIAPTEEAFVDFVLFHSYGEECDDFGRTRELTEKELEKYIPIFQQILPTVRKEQLRYVDYCFYNCTEAPDYFDEQDDFFDEIQQRSDTMKIYISGAISNNPNFKEDFERAEDYLNKEFPKAEIINPALVNSFLPKPTTHKEYMRMCFCMLDMADTIFMIDGWQKSCGASQEYGYALAKDKTILVERS